MKELEKYVAYRSYAQCMKPLRMREKHGIVSQDPELAFISATSPSTTC